MRNTIFKSGLNTPRPPYSGNWRQNPWIKAPNGSSQAHVAVAADITQDRQQKAAITTWEDEGGSIRTEGKLRC
jgi:hypothetical protein